MEYLRSGHLIFNNSAPVQLVRSEASFYAYLQVVEEIDRYIKRKGCSSNELENNEKMPRVDGFYTNNRPGTGSRVIHFKDNGKLTYLEGESAKNNIHIFHVVKDMPTLWKEDASTVESYAKFYQQNFLRGYYQTEGACLYIKVAQNSTRIPGVIRKDFILLPRLFADNWETQSFERYTFVSF